MRPQNLVFDWPVQASVELDSAITVTFSTDINYGQGLLRADEIFHINGICIYRNTNRPETHPMLCEKFKMAKIAIHSEYERRKQDPDSENNLQFQLVFKGESIDGKMNARDGCKTICMVTLRDKNAPAALMASYMYDSVRILAPVQIVVQGHGDGDPVMESCLLEDKAPAKGYRGDPQDVHADIVLFHIPTGDKSAEGMQPCNVQRALDGDVNSWFFVMHDGYCLAYYPGMKDKSLECLRYFRDHYQTLRLQIREHDPDCNEETLRGLVIDYIVHHLESTFPDLEPQSHSPVFIRCFEGDIIRLNSVVPHFGLPLHETENNIRGFLLTQNMVSQDLFLRTADW